MLSIASNPIAVYNLDMRNKDNWNLVDFFCLNCGKIIKAFPSRQRKYCNDCSKDRKVKVKCLFCGKESIRHPSRQAKYCSRECMSLDRKDKPRADYIREKISATKMSKPTTNDIAGRKRANTYLYPVPEPCEECGVLDKIDRHHIDKNPQNNERSNIMFLCKLHHQRLHKNWLDRWGKR